jgi:hypothetical protein
MTPDERELVRRLLVVYPGPTHDNSADAIRWRKEEFAREFRPSERDRKKLSQELLEEAWAGRSPTDVEYALIVLFSTGVLSANLDVLIRLADSEWHHSHEDVVSALGELRDKGAVDVLYRAALTRHEYLSFDEARALAVKAIYALGGISDASAEEKLRLLAQCDDQILRDQAEARLERRGASLGKT